MQILRRLIYRVCLNKGSFCSRQPLRNMSGTLGPISTDSLECIIRILEDVAPSKYAESWDNTGLLVQSTKEKITRIILTNDLTGEVMDEVLRSEVDLIYCYHPPLFKPIKKLCLDHWKSELIIKCLENKISLYSPHTSLDVIPGGVNDWLIGCFKLAAEPLPIIPLSTALDPLTCIIKVQVKAGLKVEDVESKLKQFLSVTMLTDQEATKKPGTGEEAPPKELSLSTTWNNRITITKWLEDNCIPYTVEPLQKPDKERYGAGRYGILKDPITLGDAIDLIKMHVKNPAVSLTIKPYQDTKLKVKSVAVCAGSGASVLMQCPPVDLMVTGEISHHDALELMHRGTCVLACEHSQSERGYLPKLRDHLASILPSNIKLQVSSNDHITQAPLL